MTGADQLAGQVDVGDLRDDWAEVLRLQREAVDALQLAEAAFSPEAAEGAAKIETAANVLEEADIRVIETPAPDVAGLVVKLETSLRYNPDMEWQEAILDDARRLADEAQATAWPGDWTPSMDEAGPRRRSAPG